MLAASCGARTTIETDRLDFSFPDLEGNAVAFSDARFRGKVVLVDLWGTWCDPCRRSVPFLVALDGRHRDSGLEVVGIAFEKGGVEERRDRLRRFAAEQGIRYLVLDGGEPDDVAESLPGIRAFGGFPTTLFVGRDGRVRDIEVGFFPRWAKRYERTVRELLAEPAGAGG